MCPNESMKGLFMHLLLLSSFINVLFKCCSSNVMSGTLDVRRRMLMLAFVALLQIFWSLPPVAICASVSISPECRAYCESQRPRGTTSEESFKVDCSSFKDTAAMMQCEEMCETNICPQQAVCQSRGQILQCPPRNDTQVDVFYTEVGWEVVVLYVGFGVGFLLCVVIVTFCILDHIQYRRLQRNAELERQMSSTLPP